MHPSGTIDLEHLAPIVRLLELPLYVAGNLRTHRLARGARHGLPDRRDREPVLVAGYKDEKLVRAHSGRPIILLEHGAGQDYGSSGGGGYAGGPDRDDVVLFLCPNRTVAERNRAVYPRARIAVVGSPKLDPWHLRAPARSDPPTIALAWHWDCVVVPEARSAFRHYIPALGDLARAYPDRVLGHGHPRFLGQIAPVYREHGIEVVVEFEEVLARADLLAFDSTSAGYEFASTGRPVVVLNAPWYRRHVEHGLRFWELLPGLTIDSPSELLEAVQTALEDPEPFPTMRERAVRAVYAAADGRAAERAAEAILELEGGQT
jgi:hypothetical protein